MSFSQMIAGIFPIFGINILRFSDLLFGKLGYDGFRYQVCLKCAIEQKLDSLSPFLSVIHGPLVDIHTYEAIRCRGIQISGKLHCIFQSFLPMIESILNAFF